MESWLAILLLMETDKTLFLPSIEVKEKSK